MLSSHFNVFILKTIRQFIVNTMLVRNWLYRTKNRKIFIYVISVLFLQMLSCSKPERDLGNVVIDKYHTDYENTDIYYPHDGFMINEMLEKSTWIERINHSEIMITNVFNDGLTGHEVKMWLSSKLKINKATYNEWTDVIDGSETEYTVDKVILQLNKNPFLDSLITGFYTLQINNKYKAGKILGNEGYKDKSFYTIFHGKFKFYNSEQLNNGKDWIVEQNEIKRGIKDITGVYYHVDKFAKFELGDTILKRILSDLNVKRADVNVEKKAFVTLSFIVDKDGKIDRNNLSIIEECAKSDILLERIKNADELWSNWAPAEYKGEKVKSNVNLSLLILE